ncbi:MAG TPA: iron ABC transporter [Rikenellaceae bacterium]|nr:iron ABC transporter [Rikenellaceae bacterium]
MKIRSKIFLLLSTTLLLAGVDLLTGGVGLSGMDSSIFIRLRLPRMLVAVFAGAGLSLAGLQMQSIFRNPLADPHIMGVSAGAGTGAATVTLIIGSSLPAALSGFTVAAAAFLGALLTSMLVVAVASKVQSTTILLIFGVMIGFIFIAITSILEYSANAESLKVFYSWSAGSFSGCRPGEIAVIAGSLAIGTFLTLINNKGLDIALFGNEYARLTGANISKIRSTAMISSCLMAGSITAFCGPLGFVGIVAPHIARGFLGSSVHVTIIPAVMLIGAGLALTADILSNVFPTPLPIGSTMALIGIPIIMAILIKRR